MGDMGPLMAKEFLSCPVESRSMAVWSCWRGNVSTAAAAEKIFAVGKRRFNLVFDCTLW